MHISRMNSLTFRQKYLDFRPKDFLELFDSNKQNIKVLEAFHKSKFAHFFVQKHL